MRAKNTRGWGDAPKYLTTGPDPPEPVPGTTLSCWVVGTVLGKDQENDGQVATGLGVEVA